MALTVTDLLALFPAEGQRFTLAGEDLGIDGVADLFTEHLSVRTLVLADTVADRDSLTVSGTVAADPLGGERPAWIRFDTDPDRERVVGFELAISVPGWHIKSGTLDVTLEFLRGYGAVAVHLVLAAVSLDDADPDAGCQVRDGIGLELGLFGPALYLSALTPGFGDTFRAFGWFDPVSVENLRELAVLAPGLPAEAFALPEQFSHLLGSPRITGIGLDFDPYATAIVAGYANVELADSWSLAGGLFELSEVSVGVGMASPTAQGFVRLDLGAVLTIADVGVAVTISVPGGELSGTLTEPVPLAELAEQFFGGDIGLPQELTVSELRIWTDTARASSAYEFELGLAGVWELTGGVTIDGLSLLLESADGARTVTVAGVFGVGVGEVVVRAVREPGGGWSFGGAAAGITLADLTSVLEDTFGAPGLPDVVAGLTLAQLSVEYATGTRQFVLTAGFELPLGGDENPARFDLGIELTPKQTATGFDKRLSAALRIPLPVDAGTSRAMDLTVTLGDAGAFSASWSEEGEEPISVLDMLAAAGVDTTGLRELVPDSVWPEMRRVVLGYDRADGTFALVVATARVSVLAAATPIGTQRVTALVVDGRIDAKLSALPLIGSAVPSSHDVVLTTVGFGWAAQPLGTAQVAAIDRVLTLTDAGSPPRLPATGMPAGVSVTIGLTVAGAAQPPLMLNPPKGSRNVAVRDGGGITQALNVVAGPVRVTSIGAGFADGRIFVTFDATLSVPPVQLSLIGLGVAISTDFAVSPRLHGAGINMDKPPVRLTGALERRPAGAYDEVFAGFAAVETPFFGLLAAGSYVRSHEGWTSMFLFGEIAGHPQLGLFGPPAFRVNALSLGFGINSTVRQPRIDEVSEFPLVQRLSGGGDTTPEQVLERLSGSGGWITPKQGQYWGAGGLEFSSFKFLEAKVLLLVEGGQDWKVMLLGRAVVDLPRSKAAKKPIARVAVDLAIAYRADENLFSMDVVVAPGSYILDPAAELSGGLSLYIWGKDRTAVGGGRGFVFTLGGYHKKFNRPSYYPVVPRVGWLWQRGPVVIRGQVYAAVTDGAFMAGGALDARYDAKHGIRVEAWFSAWLDVLVQWKPFYFDLSMGMSIGVAASVKVLFVRVRVSLSVGVELTLWGPPVGGRVKVKVWFVSFTIGIGADRDGPAAIGWDEFRMQLPSPLSVTPLRGILADVAPVEIVARTESGEPTLVSTDGFTIATGGVIPATEITLNGTPREGVGAATVNIRPMDKQGVRSVHKVSVWLGDITEPGTRSVFDPEDENAGWTVTVVEQDMPKSLWGDKLNSASDVLDGDGLLTGVPVGLRFDVPEPELGDSLGPVSSLAFKIEPQRKALLPPRDAATEGPTPVVNPRSIAAIIDEQTGVGSGASRERRTAVHEALSDLGFAPGADGPLTAFADRAAKYFTDEPLTSAAP